MKRASIEPNFHTLYAQFIDHLKKADMLNMVIRETFRNIKVRLYIENRSFGPALTTPLPRNLPPSEVFCGIIMFAYVRND